MSGDRGRNPKGTLPCTCAWQNKLARLICSNMGRSRACVSHLLPVFTVGPVNDTTYCSLLHTTSMIRFTSYDLDWPCCMTLDSQRSLREREAAGGHSYAHQHQAKLDRALGATRSEPEPGPGPQFRYSGAACFHSVTSAHCVGPSSRADGGQRYAAQLKEMIRCVRKMGGEREKERYRTGAILQAWSERQV